METRAQSLIEVNKQIEEIKTKHNDDAGALRSELATLKTGFDRRFNEIQSGIDEKLNGITHMLADLFPRDPQKRPIEQTQDSTLLSTMQRTPQPADPPNNQQIGLHPTEFTRTGGNSMTNNSNFHNRLSKIGFPVFDGSHMRDWMYKCEQFFSLDNTPHDSRVQLATIHMSGKALTWHHNFMAERYGAYPSWPEYLIALAKRFGESYDDPLSELVNMKQSADSVDEYLEKFENAITRLSLPPAHALSIFLANLNPQLALHTRQFHISDVAEAARIARLHESYLTHNTTTKQRTPLNPNPPRYNTYYKNNNSPLISDYKTTESTKPLQPKPTFIPRNFPNQQPRNYTNEEMQDRKNKGLCMFCEEKFTPGHHLKHRKAQIYVLEYDNGELSDSPDDDENELQNSAVDDDSRATPTLSINALNGSATFNCMRLTGQSAKRKLHILIDPGSTHNFLDLAKAKELGVLLQQAKPMAVAAAHGDNMLSNYKCDDFLWQMQGYSFNTQIRMLPLTCCDFVLGVQWLSTLGPILWDFNHLRMEFHLNNTKHVLRGSDKSTTKLIKGSSLNKIMMQA